MEIVNLLEYGLLEYLSRHAEHIGLGSRQYTLIELDK